MRSVLAIAVLAALFLAAPTHAACNLNAPTAKKAGAACAGAWMDRNLKINDIMTVGTHNSFKQAIGPGLMKMIRFGSSKDARAMDYAMPSIREQLADGARALEFDIVHDPKGGAYANPAGTRLGGDPLPENYAAEMGKPGFKVMHIQDVDFRSSCLTLTDCLTIVRDWSKANPDHTPLLIAIQPRDEEIPMPGAVTPAKFDAAAFDALDAEILSVIERKQIITPDQLRGKHKTLREAALKGGWPSLAASRGKIIFALTAPGRPQHSLGYIGDGPVPLKGRAMFVMTEESSPAAAIIRIDDPIKDKTRIAESVKAGFIVRTRSDAATEEARNNDVRRRDAALSGGAQYVVTDYPRPDIRFGDYQVKMPDGSIAGCNTLRTAARCGGAPVEPRAAFRTAEH